MEIKLDHDDLMSGLVTPRMMMMMIMMMMMMMLVVVVVVMVQHSTEL